MKRLKKILMVACLGIIAVIQTACPYIAHGTSEAAEFVSLDEVQGCFYGATLKDWENQTCIPRNISNCSKKFFS